MKDEAAVLLLRIKLNSLPPFKEKPILFFIISCQKLLEFQKVLFRMTGTSEQYIYIHIYAFIYNIF